MKAVSKGKYKTIVEAPTGATLDQLKKKADQYIKGEYTIVKSKQLKTKND